MADRPFSRVSTKHHLRVVLNWHFHLHPPYETHQDDRGAFLKGLLTPLHFFTERLFLRVRVRTPREGYLTRVLFDINMKPRS